MFSLVYVKKFSFILCWKLPSFLFFPPLEQHGTTSPISERLWWLINHCWNELEEWGPCPFQTGTLSPPPPSPGRQRRLFRDVRFSHRSTNCDSQPRPRPPTSPRWPRGRMSAGADRSGGERDESRGPASLSRSIWTPTLLLLLLLKPSHQVLKKSVTQPFFFFLLLNRPIRRQQWQSSRNVI